MSQRIIIPRMGQTMTEGVIAQWYVKEGATVMPDDDIYELEYDKSTAVVTAKNAGTVHLLYAEGSTVALGETVAVILEDGETLDSVNVHGEHSVANIAKSGKAAKAPLEALASAVKNEASAPAQVTYRITPLARKLAQEKGMDISKIVPENGKRIEKSDILNFKEVDSQTADSAAVENRVSATSEPKRVKLSGIRKRIAENMTQSYFTYPTVTLTTDCDMSEFLKLREQMNESYASLGIKISVTDLLIKAASKALKDNEIVNTSLTDDEIIFHSEVNIGIAVAFDKGLVVPVIRNADKLDIKGISSETSRLISLARFGGIAADDMSGGTFTITNLGAAGIDGFNPIINIPQSAILGVGRIVEKVVVTDGEIMIRPRTVFSITHDHRVIDGVQAANFLRSVVNYIEKPFLMLAD